MRLHRLRFDIWLCLLVAYLVSLGTGPQPPPSARPRMTAMQRFTPLLLARRQSCRARGSPGTEYRGAAGAGYFHSALPRYCLPQRGSGLF